MTKHLNEDAMRSELTGSAFFQPKASAPVEPATPSATSPISNVQDSPAARPEIGPDVRTPELPPDAPYGRTSGRRVITRYAFEFYQDQVARLRAISLEAKLRGEDGSMSEMVREALDAYLATREEATPR